MTTSDDRSGSEQETDASDAEKAAQAESYGGVPVSEDELAEVWEADPK